MSEFRTLKTARKPKKSPFDTSSNQNVFASTHKNQAFVSVNNPQPNGVMAAGAVLQFGPDLRIVGQRSRIF